MDTGLFFSCKIGSLPESTFSVVDFTLEEALSTLFTLEIKVVSDDANIDMDEQLLQKASLTIKVNGQVKRTVNGIVGAAFRGDSGFHRTYYTFTVRPELWLLTLTQDNRIFHFKSIPDILDELLQKHNVRVESKLMDSHKQWEYTTQRNETDYAFFYRLAAEEGIVFWFEENNLFYSDSRTGMTGGENLLYNSHVQSASREAVIHRLEYGAKMTPNAVHLKDYKFSHPDVGLDSKVQQTGQRPLYTMYESYGRYDDDGVAEQYAKYRLEAYQANSLSGQAESNSIQLMPGKIFTLSEHPTSSMNSNWQVVKIVHRGTLPQSASGESAEGSAAITNQFTFIPGSVDWRAPFTPKPIVYGDETATVVGPAGEEIYVNEFGQVKIHFHWNKYDAPDENASCWIRVAQNWNGDGFGFLSTPRIGQEVVVSYLNGDIDQPIIIGTTYNGKNSPPLDLPAAKTQMSIKSKTHKGQGFNELRFEDSDGKQEVFMHAQRDMNTSVRNNRSTVVDVDHTENIGQHQTINVKANQSTNVGGDQSIDVTGQRTDHVVKDETVNIDANQKITVGADQTIEVVGNRTDHVKVNETVNIDGNQEEKIKGYQTIDVIGYQNLTVTGAQTTTYKAAHTMNITGVQTITADSARNLTVNGLLTEKFNASHQVDVTGTQKIDISALLDIHAREIVLKGDNEITIECGVSKITMTAGGQIDISGVDITIDGTNITETALAKHEISGVNVRSNGSADNTVEGGVVKINP